MDTEPLFFFGATSRPVMIRLSKDFTLFSGRFCDCTGLYLMLRDEDNFSGLHLRTPHEVDGLIDWLRSLPPPAHLQPGEADQVCVAYPGFSPEFQDESIEDVYDATELKISAVWRNDQLKGMHLHLDAHEPDGVDVQGIPFSLLPVLCDALQVFAHEWEVNDIDLTKEQPLAHIPAERRSA